MDQNSVALEAKTVLVVEDNSINLLFIETVLMGAGYRILSAENGAEALSLLEKELPGLILMDVQMPVMDGMECARRIRSNRDPNLRIVPIVALTGYVMDVDVNRCYEAGMGAFLSKPFEEEELLDIVAAEYGKVKPENRI